MLEINEILKCLQEYEGVVITKPDLIESLYRENYQSQRPIGYFPAWLPILRKEGVNFYQHPSKFDPIELGRRLDELGGNQDDIKAILHNLRPMPVTERV